jgi:hypothetical protein
MYVGTGVGLVLFVIVALMPSALIGGALGIRLSTALMGEPLAQSVMTRMLAALGMVTGTLLGAVIFVVGTSLLGWTAGTVADAVRERKTAAVEETVE